MDNNLSYNEMALRKFDEGRNILLLGEINSQLAASIMLRLLLLDDQNNTEDINLYIDSPGGEIQAGFMIIDTMNAVSAPVRTICCGMAASMASIILSSGEIGKRCIFPHGQVLIHEPRIDYQQGITVTASGAAELSSRLKGELELTEKILADRSEKKVSFSEIKAMCQRETWLNAEEALKTGLVDRIITPVKNLVHNPKAD
jgi:ATP-dependent Clp protease, protease subunit